MAAYQASSLLQCTTEGAILHEAAAEGWASWAGFVDLP